MEPGNHNASSDLNHLSTILNSLRNSNLITVKENNEINQLNGMEEKNGKIYQILMKKDLKVSMNILLKIKLGYSDIRRAEGNENEDDERNNPLNYKGNPLENNTIIQQVFKYLDLGNIKGARTVCKKWKAVAEPFFRTMSEIHFKNPNIFENRTTADFFQTFGKEMYRKEIRFSCFNFAGYEEFNTRILTNFFRRQGNCITELTFHNINLKKIAKARDSYDISHWIKYLPLKKLQIFCSSLNAKTHLVVSLNTLTSVQNLVLESCSINVSDTTVLSPKRIVLLSVSFYCGKDLLENFRLNDAFNFNGAEYVEIGFRDMECHDLLENFRLNDAINFKGAEYGEVGFREMVCHDTVNFMVLDFCDNVTVDCLKLISATTAMINWENSKWKVKHLEMDKTPFIVRTGMRFRELELNESLIDLGALNKTRLEKLSIESSDITCAEPIVFTKLKYLRLSGQNVISFASNFLDCYALRDLEFYGYKGPIIGTENRILNSDLVPENMKRLKLYGVKMSGSKCNIPLDLLILQEYSFHQAATLLTRLKPKVLVLNWKRNYEINDCAVEFLTNTMTVEIERLIIGPFVWDDFPFANSSLSKYVDQEGKYYSFEPFNFTKLGNSLSQLEFSKMLNL